MGFGITGQAAPHPLDPLRVEEVRKASQTLLKHLRVANNEVRFKVVDLLEPPKDLTINHLSHNGPAPDRKARVYYHRNKVHALYIAFVNITQGTVEKVYDEPESQGPVDWIEFELVHNACLEHPDVKAEVAKLKLPAQ